MLRVEQTWIMHNRQESHRWEWVARSQGRCGSRQYKMEKRERGGEGRGTGVAERKHAALNKHSAPPDVVVMGGGVFKEQQTDVKSPRVQQNECVPRDWSGHRGSQEEVSWDADCTDTAAPSPDLYNSNFVFVSQGGPRSKKREINKIQARPEETLKAVCFQLLLCAHHDFKNIPFPAEFRRKGRMWVQKSCPALGFFGSFKCTQIELRINSLKSRFCSEGYNHVELQLWHLANKCKSFVLNIQLLFTFNLHSPGGKQWWQKQKSHTYLWNSGG